MDIAASNRDEIRDFLTSRRARVTPDQVGLPAGSRRRVPGLRREEVAVLAGVSTEWYARLEKGHIGEVSEEVLDAVSRAILLTDEERGYLFDLARAARSTRRPRARSAERPVGAPVRWLLDSMTLSAGFLRDARLDVVASNPLARALHAPMFDSPTSGTGRANFARFHFLDPTARGFFVDWEAGAAATVALLRAAAGRDPGDRPLRELIGELSTQSDDFCRLWMSHDIRTWHEGVKRLQHPTVGYLEVTYQALELAGRSRGASELSTYTAEPGTEHEDALRMLASWAVTVGAAIVGSEPTER